MSEPTRTLYYQLGGGAWFKMVIPETAKVTFGPLLPTRQEGFRSNGETGLYLRVYKTKDHQLAVIPHVVQFRDSSLELFEPDLERFIPVTEETYLGNMVQKELKGEEER